MSDEREHGTTASGRRVVVCYCGGGPAHEWQPSGGGARVLACPSDEPQPRERETFGESRHPS